MPLTPLILDLELTTDGQRLRDVGALFGHGELHERKLDKLEPWLKEAEILAGHNILRHDAPFLRQRLGEEAMAGKKLCDTLCWSPLLYADKPYHKLVKGYKLHDEEAENNPLSDAKLCRQLLNDLLGKWRALPEPLQQVFRSLLHDRPGYDGFLALIEEPDAPVGDAAALARTALGPSFAAVPTLITLPCNGRLNWPMPWR